MVLALLMAAPAFAESSLYVLPSYMTFTVDDPEGSTSEGSFSPLLIRWMNQAAYDSAWYTEFGYLTKTSIDASGSSPGLSFSGYQLGAGYAWRFRASRELKPWVTLGLRLTQAEYTGRHTVDSDGFLIATFPDQTETAANATASVSNVWSVSKAAGLGVWAEYGASVSGSLSWFGVGAVASYEF
jgi:hypothetical protein